MIEVMSKNGALPSELLAFFCWAEVYVHDLTVGGKGGKEMFKREQNFAMGQINNEDNLKHGLRYIWMEVQTEDDLNRMRRCFPNLFGVS